MEERELRTRKSPGYNFAIYVVVFLAVLLYSVYSNFRNNGALYIPTPDGDLYLSIAENFVRSGHFIQTSRPYEMNFIVPPGLPAVLTLIFSVAGEGSLGLIMVLQYCLFALSAVLLMASGGELCKGAKCNVIIPWLFLSCLKTNCVNPGMILTETYTVFLLSLALYLFVCDRLSEQTKVVYILAVFLLTVFIRPAMAGLVLLPIVHVFRLGFTKKPDKMFYSKIVLLVVLFVSGLFINAGVNKRETGYFVLLQNYGGVSFYQANNANTKSDHYSSDKAADFSDSYFFEVYQDSTLDMQQKNELLNAKAKQFILKNPIFCIKKALGRYKAFLKTNAFRLCSALLSMLVLWRFKYLNVTKCVCLLGAFLILTAVPSFGLYIERYYIYHIVLTSTLFGSFFQFLYDSARNLYGRRLIASSK